ncbi:MAG: TonB-dependent receptor plug domain-containing protein, partial [Pseudomonadota bacterium]
MLLGCYQEAGRPLSLALLIFCFFAAEVYADTKAINVEAQPLRDALLAIADHYQVTVLASDELVRGKSSPSIQNAGMTALQAVQRSLADTDLSARAQGNTILVESTPTEDGKADSTENASAPPGASNQNDQIEELVVVAHARDYGNTTAQAAFGIDTELLKTPASISVINEDLLKDLQVNNVDEALRNVAGVTRFKTGNGGEEKFTIRGFDVSNSIYKDGAPINNGLNVSNVPSTETANIERIEVLKGPSAILYGEGEPGGIINYITKKPERERYSYIELLGGSDSFYKVEADTTGAFTQGSNWAYRIAGSYEDSENFRDEVTRQRLLLNPSIAYFSDNTSVVIGLEYLDDDFTQDRGQVLDGDIITGYSYSNRLDDSQFFGVPGHNDQTTAE